MQMINIAHSLKIFLVIVMVSVLISKKLYSSFRPLLGNVPHDVNDIIVYGCRRDKYNFNFNLINHQEQMKTYGILEVYSSSDRKCGKIIGLLKKYMANWTLASTEPCLDKDLCFMPWCYLHFCIHITHRDV